MTKVDLINKLVAELKNNEVYINAKTVDKILKAFVQVITSSVVQGEKVVIPGLGSFESKERAARTGRNPANGETIQIPAKTVPAFKTANAFKTLVVEANKK